MSFNSSAAHRHGAGRHMTDSGGGGLALFSPGTEGSTAESGTRASPGSGPPKPSQRPTFDSSSPVGKILGRIYALLLEALIRMLPPEAEIQQTGIPPSLCGKIARLIDGGKQLPCPAEDREVLDEVVATLRRLSKLEQVDAPATPYPGRAPVAEVAPGSQSPNSELQASPVAEADLETQGPDSEPQAPPEAGPGTEEAKREHLIGILRELGIKGASLASTWKTETLERKAAEALKAQRTPANDEA